MPKSQSIVQAVFRGIARTSKTHGIAIGPIRARGVPAILVGVAGVILAGSVVSLVSRASGQLPETLRDARGLIETLRSDRKRLNP